MKKKLMMVAVLLGALSLGACVDDNESASVTAVRTAKAKQLEAVAALNNAQAEAELIKANAEKALKEAQAAYEKAQADATAADTEYNKQKYMLELEKIKAEYAQLIANYKAQTTEYEKDLWDNADAFVKDVYGKYITALGEVNTINKDLIDQSLRLAQIDIDAIQAKTALESFLYGKNQIIAEKTLEIARLEALKTADKAAIEKQMSEMSANAYNLVKSNKPAAQKSADTKEEAFDKIYNPINIQYGKLSTLTEHEKAAWEANLLPYLKAWQILKKYSMMVSSTSPAPLFTPGEFYGALGYDIEIVEVDICPENSSVNVYPLSSKGDFINAKNYWTKDIEDKIEAFASALGEPSVKDKSAATGLYIELEAAQAEVAKASEDLAAELKKAAADQDKDKIKAWQQIIDKSGPQRIAYAEDAIATKNAEIDEAKKDLKELTDAIAAVQDAAIVAEYEKAVADAKEAAKAYLTANHEVHKINDAIALIGILDFDSDGKPNSWSTGEYGDLLTVLFGAVNVDELILACKEEIAEAEAAIKAGGAQGMVTVSKGGEYSVYDPISGNWITSGIGEVRVYKYAAEMTVEQKKAIIQAEIDKLNEKLKTQQALVKQYKAKLDTLLAAE